MENVSPQDLVPSADADGGVIDGAMTGPMDAPPPASPPAGQGAAFGTAKKRALSLKYKLLILLVSLPLVSLLLYLILATRLFESDKLAYVFDSTAMAVRSVGARTRVELETVVRDLSALTLDYDESLQRFSPLAKAKLETSPFQAVKIYRLKPSAASELKVTFEAESYLKRSSEALDGMVKEPVEKSLADSRGLQQFLVEALGHPSAGGIYLKKPMLESADFIWMVKFYRSPRVRLEKGQYSHAVVGFLRLEGIFRAVQGLKTLSGYLVDPKGRVLFGPDVANPRAVQVQSFSDWKFYNDLRGKRAPEGTVEAESDSANPLLASYSMVGLGDLTAIGLVKKSEALKAVRILLWKSIIFFIALVSFAVMTSVIASGQLTATLRALATATEKVAGGDFDVTVKVGSLDEVGMLGQSFNRMAAEVKRLVSETADKARMQKELETAKAVQETLFPDSKFKTDRLELSGVYQPASECGGDWWYHTMIGGKLYLWIGDATGHGVPAALLTSAARSAASIISLIPDMTPGRAMTFLNNAIHHSSKGGMMMTFFIASIDPSTGEVVYSNASHDPPFLLRDVSQKLAKKNLEPLNECNNPRLGEMGHHEYSEARFNISPGDAIFFYTDGVPDVKNPEGVALGQRAFVKAICAAAGENKPVIQGVDEMRDSVMGYRNNAELPDDVTFILCKYT